MMKDHLVVLGVAPIPRVSVPSSPVLALHALDLEAGFDHDAAGLVGFANSTAASFNQ